MLVSFITDSIIIQTAVFVVSSIALIFLTKPFVKKYIDKDAFVPTNAYSIIGRKAKVIQDVSDTPGQVKVKGEVWTAVSENDSLIEKGKEVEIVKIDGVKLVVRA